VEVNFGHSAPFSLGVEEEFQLVSPESYDLVSRYDAVAEAAGSDERIKPELMQSVLEVATGISGTVAEALEEARRLRRRVRDAAAERDTVIASAGTHPFARWEHQDVTDEPRYVGLMEKMQWVAERELIFGLHVHVGMESAPQAVAVANGLRTWLPELLALSANSPFWQARDTGLSSTRTQVFETFPRSGLPPAFGSFEEFELVVERGARTNSFRDYTYIWWDLRPHPRLGTIEVRICDAQTRLENVAGIVALVQSLAATLAERFERGGTPAVPVQPATLIGENKWRAVRYGLGGKLIDLERDTELAARDAVAALV
jgi:glutamate---cysteine ligase / carboxylate-amine ligase